MTRRSAESLAQGEAVGATRGLSASDNFIKLSSLTKEWTSQTGSTYCAVRDISLTAKTGEFVSVVGPSGCGKSTILNMIAGVMRPTAGQVEVADQVVKSIRTDIGYVYQHDALLPWKRVRDNVALPLRMRRKSSAEEIESQTRLWLERVGLAAFGDYYPHQLSGGMRKRVSLAQCLIYNPSVLLMDEPFAALDVQTRNKMETELLDLCQRYGKTVLFVTHDLEEAIALADRVLVLTAGPAAMIKAEFPIDLPRPRDVSEIRSAPGFSEAYRAVWEALRSEVDKSYSDEQQRQGGT